MIIAQGKMGDGMDILYILVIAGVLAIDAFVVSISCGVSHTRSNLRFCTKVSFFFGIAQALFFGIGFIFGVGIDRLFSGVGHWIAFFLLSFVGVKMIFESIRAWKKTNECRSIGNRTLMLLSVATSIDALAVGMTFAVLDIQIIVPLSIVGLVTFILSFIGVMIGDGLSGRFGKVAEIIGGSVLVGLGAKILFENLVG